MVDSVPFSIVKFGICGNSYGWFWRRGKDAEIQNEKQEERLHFPTLSSVRPLGKPGCRTKISVWGLRDVPVTPRIFHARLALALRILGILWHTIPPETGSRIGTGSNWTAIASAGIGRRVLASTSSNCSGPSKSPGRWSRMSAARWAGSRWPRPHSESLFFRTPRENARPLARAPFDESHRKSAPPFRGMARSAAPWKSNR